MTLLGKKESVYLNLTPPKAFIFDWQGTLVQAGTSFLGGAEEALNECLFPGIKSLLHFLAEASYPLMIISNMKHAALQKEVETSAVSTCFSQVRGATSLLFKPHPDIVEDVLWQEELAPGPDIWFVGDSFVDMACARASGCTGILVQNGGLRRAASYEYDLSLAWTTDLKNLLTSLK